MNRNAAALFLGAGLAALTNLPAYAQAPAVPSPPAAVAPFEIGGRTAYPAAFFVDSQANNAFEMLQRVPGFTLNQGDTSLRGFAGAGGNVLIDGERPASKSVTLEDLLRRIPLSAIERIELVRAGDPDIDLQGQPLVANVVRRQDATGAWAVSVISKAYTNGWLAPGVSVEGAQKLGAWQVEGSGRLIYEYDTRGGYGRRTLTAASGVPLVDNRMDWRERGYTGAANVGGTLRRKLDVLRLNLGVDFSEEGGYETLTPRLTNARRKSTGLEIGGDYERALSSALSSKLVVLQTLGNFENTGGSIQAGRVESSESDEKSGESIVRGSLTWRPSAALSLEGGAEGAFNWLESTTALSENGRPVPIPNDDTRVEERRAEAFATSVWTASPKLSLEGALRVETSKITQSGDSALSRTFFFVKPRANVTYTPNSLTNWRLRIERRVGQLDFGDFAASSELNLGTVSAGNAELAPERGWVVETAFERRFWGEGAAVLTLMHEWVEDVVDRLPVNGVFDGPGNIGNGTRDQAKLNITVPLDRLGLRGGRIAGEGFVLRTRVTDPGTGRERPITRERPYGGSLTFTHDLPQISSTWGLSVDFGSLTRTYRIDETRREYRQPWWRGYFEWKPRPDLSIRGEVENITTRLFDRRRTFFDGPRSLNIIEAVERRETRMDPFVNLRIRKQF